MVGVEVTEYQRVVDVGEVENGGDVEAISVVAGGSRRNVTVQDVDGVVVDGCGDAENFQVFIVGDGGDVEGRVADGVMYQGD